MKTVKSILLITLFLFYCSEKGMSQWVQIGLPTDRVISLAVKTDGTVFAGTYSNGLNRSTGNYSTWSQVLGPPSVYEVYSVAFDSSGGVLAGTHVAGLYRSANNGTNWTPLSSSGSNSLPVDDIYSIAVSPTGTIFVADGTGLYGEVFRSNDVGGTWQSVLNPTYGIYTLAASTSGNLYAGGASWFYNSTNNGDTWNWKGSSSGLTKAPIVLAARNPNYVIAGTSGSGVFLSKNNGENWSEVNTNLTNKYITALVMDDTTIYAGTDGGGIFKSIDNGSNWTELNTGLTDKKVNSLAIGNSCLYAGMNGSGVWKIPLKPDVTAVPSFEKGTQVLLKQNFPNPVTQNTTIPFTTLKKSFVTLKVYDHSGKHVATLVSEELPAGNYSRQWNASAMPNGIYYYRLTSGAATFSKKLILSR
jgi:photosystem II stability/assembly factor-like uncharacterized protein